MNVQVLFRLDTSPQAMQETTIAALESAGLRILAAWLPQAVLGEMEPQAAYALAGHRGVRDVYVEAVPADALAQAPEDFRVIAVAWNSRRHHRAESDSEGLAWDAPTHLAPDPPPRIQAMLRRREKKLRSGAD